MVGSMLETPYPIATLPKPLDTKHGRTYLAPVYSISGSRKRKRQEVAVGVDGEGVNIYNVQSQRLVTSYAIPPQQYLCHRPCSIHVRGSQDRPPARRTYVVVKDRVDDSKRRLVCFTENTNLQHDTTIHAAVPKKRECTLEDGEISGLDVAASAGSNEPFVVVSYVSGRVVCISPDFRTQEVLPALMNQKTEYMTLLDVDSAKKGMLRNREDAVATMGSGSTLLLTIVQLKGERRVRLHSMRTPSDAALQTSNASASLLTEVVLPQASSPRPEPAQFDLHTISGKLYQCCAGRLDMYDLCSISPKLMTSFGSKKEAIGSFSALSSSLIVTSSLARVDVWDTKFGALMGSMPLSEHGNNAAAGQKRKRGVDVKDESTTLTQLCPISKTGPIVGVRGQQLIVAPLSNDLTSTKPSPTPGTRLADIVRRSEGVTRNRHSGNKDEKKFQEWSTAVDSLIESGDVSSLEKLIAQDPTLGRQREHQSRDDEKEENNDEQVVQDLWPLPETLNPSILDHRRALYILGKVFGYENDRLIVRFPSFKLVEWLALCGLLSTSQINKAWRQYNLEDLAVRSAALRSGDVTSALHAMDDDLQLVHDCLSLPISWPIEEIAQALNVIVRSLDQPAEAPDGQLALPPPSTSNGDVAMANGDASLELELQSEAAEKELEHALTALGNGLAVRSDTLRIIFSRLLSFDQKRITKALRDTLPHRELLIFINVLRLELAGGGWTSRYIDSTTLDEQIGMVDIMNGLEEGGPSDEALKTIAFLLNCAVDAIGHSGWLIGLGGAPDLLMSLKAEISAGLEGCYDAVNLGGALVDVLRLAGDGKKFKKGREMVGEDLLLPVAGRVEPAVVRGRGGPKSKVELAQEKSRRVGKYSFERIRV